MLAYSSPLFSTNIVSDWPLEESTSHQQSYTHATSTSPLLHYLHFPSSCPDEPEEQRLFEATHPGAATMAKKLNHNANERDRRKKINNLYSTLRSLLPVADQRKKLSIPVTVSWVLKYIPELQHQVQKLTQEKEEVLLRVARQRDITSQEREKRRSTRTIQKIPGPSISANPLTESEIAVQISTCKFTQTGTTPLLSEILNDLDDHGYRLMNASTFESFGGRTFYNLHVQVERRSSLACGALTEKLLSLYDQKRDEEPQELDALNRVCIAGSDAIEIFKSFNY